MNSKENESEEREDGARAEILSQTSSQQSRESSQLKNQQSDAMKRAAAKQLIEKYFFQLTDGCGSDSCTNKYCASSHDFYMKELSRNQAGVQAIELFKQKAHICEQSPAKVAKIPTKSDVTSGKDASEPSTSGVSCAAASTANTSSSAAAAASTQPVKKEIPFLNETKVKALINQCRDVNNWSMLIRTVGSVFNNPESLERSFLIEPSKEDLSQAKGEQDKDKDTTEKEETDSDSCEKPPEHSASTNTTTNSNPELSETQGDSHATSDDKDEDTSQEDSDSDLADDLADVAVRDKNIDVESKKSQSVKEKDQLNDSVTVDTDSVDRTFEEMFRIPDLPFQDSLINALIYLSRDIQMDLQYHQAYERNPNILNIFVLLMQIPCLHSPEFLDTALPALCKCIGLLPTSGQARLARVWSKYPAEKLKSLLETLQQLVTVKVITGQWGRLNIVNDSDAISSAVKVMKILYYACIVGGKQDSADLLAREKISNETIEETLSDLLQGAIGRDKEQSPPKEDILGKELGVNSIDCREPLIPYIEFVNEPLNTEIEMDKDYPYYKSDSKFSFMNHSFILTTATKNLGMYFDNRIRMINERRTSMLQSLVHGAPSMPYLRLRIRRTHIIDDALVGLEMAAMDNPQDLKKQLYVEFEGEQGIDEGGVQKEFFQLVVEALFNPDIGMFTFDEDTKNFWFNPTSFENDGQFTLIGIILGLAIYNNVILDVHFPMVVYRKLMGKLGTFQDLSDSHPTLAKSLSYLLDYEGDVSETFMHNFRIGYKDVFGEDITHDLKENGSEIPVTNDNRKEFVLLYADFLLNKSVEKQFRAFKRGFLMVTDESPIKLLIRPEEVELLVCGSTRLDFDALQNATEYDGGFDENSPTIKHFWEIVHGLTEEQKRLLLQFTTGSDRVPIGGLAKLKLIIARNGPDSDRLPTAHTCFNVLLLPDYNNKDKKEKSTDCDSA